MKNRFFHELFKWSLYPFTMEIKNISLELYWLPINPQLDAQCSQWLIFIGYRSEAIDQLVGDKETIFIHPANP
jgi:hypothetical protein